MRFTYNGHSNSYGNVGVLSTHVIHRVGILQKQLLAVDLKMDKDQIAKIDYTIVGGPSHGIRISPNNGYRPVYTMLEASFGGMLEHVPHRFVVGENEAVVTVFSPPTLSVAVIEEFLNNRYSDDLMRKFDPWKGHFVE